MKAVKNGSYWLLKLEPGEEVITTLTQFLRQNRVRSGLVTGIGAAKNIVLGWFDPTGRTYRQRRFRGDYELAALVGNTAWAGPDPVAHIHAVIAGPKLTCYAGHLFAAEVTVTAELTLVTGTKRIYRALDPRSGLKLLDLGNG